MEVSASFFTSDYDKTFNIFNNSSADYMHYDVCDGKFVDNKFLSLSELEKYLKLSKKRNDIHLMVSNPEKYIEKLALYDVSFLTIHYEIKDCLKYIDLIKSYGLKVGVSIKPDTDIKEIFPILDKISLVLIMSVEPGKSGQKFLHSATDKINLLREELDNKKLNVKIEVDGGINEEVLGLVSNADILVSTSYILNDLDNIDKLKAA
jgi:Pentose-5-phosphate-3-epimerase